MQSHPLENLLLGLASVCALAPAFCAENPPPFSISDAVLWSYLTPRPVTAAPLVADGVVYCGTTGNSFFALEAATGREIWNVRRAFPITAQAAVSGDLVCFESGNTLYALDKTTGQEKWHFVARPFRPIASMDTTDYHHSAPVIAGGVVYFGDDWGNLNGVDLATGAPAFQFTTTTGRPIRSTPAIGNGIVYFGDWEGEVFAVSIADRSVVWHYSLENRRDYYGAVVSDFVIQDGLLYFGSQHDTFAPLDVATGKPAWKFTDSNRTYLPSTPLIHNGRTIIGTTIRTSSVLCLDRAGAVAWSFKNDSIFFTKPVLRDGVLIVLGTNFGRTGYLYLLDVETGNLVNKVTIERASPSSPAIDNDRLYLGSGDGRVYALDLHRLLQPVATK